MLAAVIGIVGNQLVARYKLKVGEEIKSAPLIVDARHSWLDAVSSGGALLGLVGVAAGFKRADPIAGFAISLFIVRIAIEATCDVVARLMDAQDLELATAARGVVREALGAADLRDMRVRWLGRQAEIRLVVRLPRESSLVEATQAARTLEAAVRHRLPDVREVFVTVEADGD